MEYPPKRRKVQILDYFSMIESNADKCQALTDEARRDSIRATCNICHKSISGTYRVKSNFITHLRKSHPEAYIEYQLKTGRFNFDETSSPNLSIASLNEPNMSMMGTLMPQVAHSSAMMQRGDNFGSLIPRHLPTSTVKDHSSASSPVGNTSDAQPVKVEVDEQTTAVRSRPLSAQKVATDALMDFIIGMSVNIIHFCLFLTRMRFIFILNYKHIY